MFRKTHLVAILVVAFAAALSGCGVLVGGIGYAIDSATQEERGARAEATLKPFVKFVKVKIDRSVTASILRSAKVSIAVLENDMKTVKISLSQREKELSNTATEEVLRSLSIPDVAVNVLASDTLHIEVLYAEGRELARDIFIFNFRGGPNTEENREQWLGIRKGAYVRLTLRRGDTVLMEARGLWGGNDKADEIAGARQLAREVASEVIKKLSASSATPKDATAERGAAMVLDK